MRTHPGANPARRGGQQISSATARQRARHNQDNGIQMPIQLEQHQHERGGRPERGHHVDQEGAAETALLPAPSRIAGQGHPRATGPRDSRRTTMKKAQCLQYRLVCSRPFPRRHQNERPPIQIEIIGVRHRGERTHRVQRLHRLATFGEQHRRDAGELPGHGHTGQYAQRTVRNRAVRQSVSFDRPVAPLLFTRITHTTTGFR